MGEAESEKLVAKFENQFAEELASKLNVPVFVIGREVTEKIFEEVKQIPDISKLYSRQELYDEVSNFLSTFISRPKDEAALKERIDRFLISLRIEKHYEATIILPSVIDLPVGTRLGPLEIVERNIDDKYLVNHLKSLEDREKIYTDGRSQGRLLFKSYTSTHTSIVNVLYKHLELPLAILSLVLDIDLDVRDCTGAIKAIEAKSSHFIAPYNRIRGWSRYRPDIFDEHLQRLSIISLAKKPNRLERKILQAIQVFGLSRLSHKSEIRFIFLISSFESLLLTENDRDYLGKKLSEKTAFLLKTKYKDRLKLYRQMKGFYGKRSGLVHNGKTGILDSEVRSLEYIFKSLVFKLLELASRYSKMEQKSQDNEKPGIEDYINELKFS